MRNTRTRLKAAVTTAAVTGALLAAFAVPSLANAGFVTSTDTASGGSVTGTAYFAVGAAVNSNDAQTALVCAVEGRNAVNVTSTNVHSCELFKGSTLVLSAAPSGRQTPVWTTQEVAPSSLIPGGGYTVCFDVSANFADTSTARTQDCGTLDLPVQK